MRNDGYIKLHRSILEWEWYEDSNTFHVFVHCLLSANWKDEKYKGMIIKRGSFITNYDQISLKTGLSVKQVRLSISRLKKTNEITHEKVKNHSLITVRNYEQYQLNDEDVNDKKDTQRADERHTKGNPLSLYKEEKKKEIYKERKSEMFASFWDLYPRKVSKKVALEKFEKIVSSEEVFNAIMSGLDKSLIEWKGKEKKFIPHASTWLNQERWNDEIEVPHEECEIRKYDEDHMSL